MLRGGTTSDHQPHKLGRLETHLFPYRLAAFLSHPQSHNRAIVYVNHNDKTCDHRFKDTAPPMPSNFLGLAKCPAYIGQCQAILPIPVWVGSHSLTVSPQTHPYINSPCLRCYYGHRSTGNFREGKGGFGVNCLRWARHWAEFKKQNGGKKQEPS